MEKKVKYLSILSTILLLLFITTMLAAAGISIGGEENIIFQILYYTSNFFMYAAPASFILSFGFGIYAIIKRQKERKAGKKQFQNPFPAAWFIISSSAFCIILLFVIFVIRMETN